MTTEEKVEPYSKKWTDEELKQIAVDLFHDKLFTSQHQALIDHPESLETVFMPLVFMDEAGRKQFWDAKPAMIFEYLDKAGPRSINGLPGFFSFQFLQEDEAKKVWTLYKDLKEAEEKSLSKRR